MDTSPVYSAGLEIRTEGDGSRSLSGRFPYNSLAVIDSGGNGRRPRKEKFAPKAFEWIVQPEQQDRDVHLLVGHSYDHPLASRKAGTLQLVDTDEALQFRARLTPEILSTTWGNDWLQAFTAGLIVGISPGFRVPPADAVPNAEETEEEDPAEGKALIRTINAAVLFELSLVTRPAYGETALDLRHQQEARTKPIHPALRWRA